MVLLYGYSLMYILAGIMAYQLNAFWVFVIAGGAFVAEQLVFKSLRRFLTFLGVTVGLSVIAVYGLYRAELLVTAWTALVKFVSVYWLSVTVSTVAIDLPHQVVMLGFIGLPLMVVLDYFIKGLEGHYLYLLSASLLLVLVGYLTEHMGGLRDREAFLILTATMVVYYFYSFFHRYTLTAQRFRGFAVTIGVVLIIVVAGSRMLYAIDPRPLTRDVTQVAYVPTEDFEQDNVVQNALNYFRNDVSEVAQSFEFDQIEVLRLRSEQVNYLKADTYEVYDDGLWRKEGNLPVPGAGEDVVHKSQAFSGADYRDFYAIEDVRVTLRLFNSDVVLVSNYGAINTRFSREIALFADERRGTYFTNEPMVDGDYYDFEAIIPNYGAGSFENLVRQRSGDALPPEMAGYIMPLPDRYQAIARLAAEVTEGMDNKYDQALALERYLQRNFVYNEQPAVPPAGVDPIVYFLFESKEGFCQQFATAYALMARSLKIPTRYATGFYVGERDVEEAAFEDFDTLEGIRDGVYSVYDADAHTWPEAYFPEVGWIMFEPTPGRYYKTEEKDLDLLGDDLEGAEVGQVFRWGLNPAYIWYSLGLMVFVGLLLGIGFLARKRQQLGKESPRDKMLAIHKLLRRYLKFSGLKKWDNETPREFALRADRALGDEEGIRYSDLMKDYEGVVYGGRDLTAAALKKHLAYLEQWRQHRAKHLLKVTRLWMALISYVILNAKETTRS